jgi:putative sterol carrier protein
VNGSGKVARDAAGGLVPQKGAASDGPIFILAAARSGSTLLRLILDSHPAIACPPETNLVAACGSIAFTCQNALPDDQVAAKRTALRLSRQVARQTLGAYAASSGKQRWCEKSLPTADAAESLLEIFPDATFICLYRECTDTIVSLLEACSWGFAGYGIEPYVHQNPTNLPWALAAYWADRVETTTAFEESHAEICARMRYEDLVSDPEATMARLCAFLGIDWDPAHIAPDRVFKNPSRFGVGDHKVRYTRTISPESVGRGWRVPIELIPESLRQRVDSLSEALGYPPLGMEVRDGLSILRRGVKEPVSARVAASVSISSVMAGLASRLATRRERLPGGVTASSRLKIIVTEEAKPYLVDFEGGIVSRDDLPAPCTILTDSETLAAIANGSCNPATAVRQSRLRLAGDNGQTPQDLLIELDAFVEVLQREEELVHA